MSTPGQMPERRNPWWIPRWIFGTAPAVERRKLTLLGGVSIAVFYENYDLSLLNTSLKHIAESLFVEEADLGYFVACIRFAGLFAILIIPAADLIGRRRLFLISVVGMSVGTAMTGFSQTAMQFIILQMAARGFMLTAVAMAVVILVEEFPAAHRGWAIGMLGTASVLGHAVGTLLFAGIEAMPYGWRTLYILGIIPIVRLPMFQRCVYEPDRFRSIDRCGANGLTMRESLSSWLRPYVQLARRFPNRLALMSLVVVMAYGGFAVVFSFLGYFVLFYRGLEAWQFSLLLMLSGALAIPAASLSGRLCDRFGRRPVGSCALVLFAVCTWGFFQGPVWAMFLVAVPMMCSAVSGNVVIMAQSSELFPTDLRGTSSGSVMLLGAVGAGFGLFLVGALTVEAGDIITFVPVIAFLTAMSASLMLCLPETNARELEEISWRNPVRDAGEITDAPVSQAVI